MTVGTKNAADLVGEPLDRGAAALRIGDELHDALKQRVASDLLGAHHEAAGLVDRAADDRCAGSLCDRHRFAGHHGFVDCASPLHDDAVDRHALARL